MKKLYEVSALVHCVSVILAESEADALQHVSTWEQAWTEPSNADLIGVSDVEIITSRKPKSKDWRDEAHDRTFKVMEI